MENKLVIFDFDGKAVEFEFGNGEVMVNATQMAKAFGKDVFDFLKNESTKNFIFSALKTENSRFLGVEKESDLINSKQKTGTFMHRVLALKFAAWLNSDFELWVFFNIERLMFGNTKKRIKLLETKQSKLEEMMELESELRDVPKFQDYLDKKAEVMRLGKDLKKNDLDLFASTT